MTDHELPHEDEPVYDIPPVKLKEVATAFVVFQMPDGIWGATSDLATEYSLQREASQGDFRVGCHSVEMDCVIMQTSAMAAQNVLMNMQMLQQKMMEQQEAQKIAELVGSGKPFLPRH